jgi:hypothetical protein
MTVKKTVSLHPKIDELIRKTWASLIRKGYNVNYSITLQLIILSAVKLAVKSEPLTEEELKQTLANLNNSIENMLKTVEPYL